MKRYITKPDRANAGRFRVIDLFKRVDFVIADNVSAAMARRMVQELERTFS